MTEQELYIHIPFCARRCAYCDFLSSTGPELVRRAYGKALTAELDAIGQTNPAPLRSVFWGGGTPSLLTPAEFSEIAAAVERNFTLCPSAEYTIEANPGTITEEKMAAWKAAGVNRISMGVQSLEDARLQDIGRIHTARQAKEQFAALRAYGFRNLSMDLMMGLPGQSLAQWQATLRGAVTMEPEHLSCYSLILEEGTPLYQQYEKGELSLPDEEEERAMYHWTVSFLSECGYRQYEISNFAKPGQESRHNQGYWDRVPYIGAGLGAASLAQVNGEEIRYKNTSDMEHYIKESRWPDHIREERQKLTKQDRQEEFMFLGLRKTEGIEAARFCALFGQTPEEVYAKPLQEQLKNGLLKKTQTGYCLTSRGMDLANQVFAAFLQ